MEIKDLIREINNCTSYMATFDSERKIIGVCISNCMVADFKSDVEYLDDIDINFGWLHLYGTNKQKNLGNFYALLNLINQFVNTPVEERFSAEKYTVEVFKTDYGILKKDVKRYSPFLGNSLDNEFYKSHFTKLEIEKLKRRDDIAIDWDKAIIKPVEDDE